MRLIVDTIEKKIIREVNGKQDTLGIYTKEAFEIMSQLWIKIGWNQKYTYTFSWMGRPIIQLPEDMVRIQEVIYSVKPDVIIETGIAHGGSLIYYASLCRAMGKGRVIGVDIEIRSHNREAIESHDLKSNITLIEGNSTDGATVNEVKSHINTGETVLIILDSNHTKQHVLDELEVYNHLVTPGSYIVVTDGVMKDLYDVPRGTLNWLDDNPLEAVKEFVKKHREFIAEQPSWFFNESDLTENITYWPGAWLKRL